MPKFRMNDLIVLIPGILGTELRIDDQLVWGQPEGIYEYLRPRDTLKRWTDALMLKNDDGDPDAFPQGVMPTRLIQLPQVVASLAKIDGYDLIRERLDSEFQQRYGDAEAAPNYVEFPYDWRRDNAVNALRLRKTVSNYLTDLRETRNPDAKVIYICHSMGGLIAKYSMDAIDDDELPGSWDDCRRLITLGTPFRGSVNSVNFFSNGYKMLGVDLSPVLHSCTSVYQLLPIYEMVDIGNGNFKRVDEVTIPNLDPDRARAAIQDFHGSMEPTDDLARPITALIGDAHPTLQSVELKDGNLESSEWIPDSWPAHRQSGDGTVPLISAIPIEFGNDPSGVVRFTCAHAILQSNIHLWRQLRRMLNILQDPNMGNVNAPLDTSSMSDPESLLDGPQALMRIQDLNQLGQPVNVLVETKDVDLGNAQLIMTLERVDTKAAIRDLKPGRNDQGWAIDIQDLERGTYRILVEIICRGEENPPALQDIFEIANFDPC